MLEKVKSTIENKKKKKKTFGALLTHLSKAFHCLSHENLLANLHAYGFSIPALRPVYNYLKNIKKRTKINPAFSSREGMLFGAQQGSILGPLLFNRFLCDLFYMISDNDSASYAEDNRPYVSSDTIDEVIKRLENVSIKFFKWFAYSQMKANQNKCHLVVI